MAVAVLAAAAGVAAGCGEAPEGRIGQTRDSERGALAHAAAADPGEAGQGSEPAEGQSAPVAGHDAEYGQALYAQSCITCHGTRGQGVPRQGVNLRTSPFLAGHNDAQVVAFLKQGRAPGDAASATGLPMPARGGNPALDDTGLSNIVAFLREVQDEARRQDELPDAATAQAAVSGAKSAPDSAAVAAQ